MEGRKNSIEYQPLRLRGKQHLRQVVSATCFACRDIVASGPCHEAKPACAGSQRHPRHALCARGATRGHTGITLTPMREGVAMDGGEGSALPAEGVERSSESIEKGNG